MQPQFLTAKYAEHAKMQKKRSGFASFAYFAWFAVEKVLQKAEDGMNTNTKLSARSSEFQVQCSMLRTRAARKARTAGNAREIRGL
jgi:hypothetical protein